MKQEKNIIPPCFGIEPFFGIDSDGHIITANAAAEKVTGTSSGELTNCSFITLFKEPAWAAEMLSLVQADGMVDNFPLSFFSSNGEKETDVLFNAFCIADKKIKQGNIFALATVIPKQKQPGKQSIQKIQKEVSDYKYALDESSIVAITDQRGIINHVNDNFCKISKYSRNELIGQDHRIINSGYHSEDFIKDLWVTIAHGKIWRGELKNRAKDGSFYWVDTTIVPFLDKKKKPYQYIAIRADITGRKKLEEEQAFFASIVNYSDDGIITKTLGGVLTSWNLSAEKIFGYTSAEIIGQHITTLIPAYLWSEEYEIIENIRKGKAIEQYETQRIKKDGTLIHVSITVSPLKDSHGNIIGASKIVRDITKQKKAEKELSKSLKEITDYKFALDESSIVAITDQKGIIQHANDNFCKISKYSMKELIGQDHRIINSGYHTNDFIRNLWETIAHGNIWRGELKNRAKDGTFYWVDTTIVPFLNDHKKPYQYVAIRADITQRKKAEEDILVLNEELETRVKERTEEMESFSYSVSHDLRAPLRAVNGYARILEEDYKDLFDAEGKRLLGEVQQNAKKMGILIDDLLAFSRLGRKEIEKKVIDMSRLAKNTIHEINQTFQHHASIKLTPLHPVEADHALMQHVMINLISNAVKYSGKKEKPVIEISSKQEAGQITYAVSDNGVGFDMQYAHKLFGVFQRLHSADEFPGTGVGLAMVKRIINKHRGTIWAESRLHEGTTFYFKMPANHTNKN